jgi:outer membrane murein-binding lipoprotein Lpp
LCSNFVVPKRLYHFRFIVIISENNSRLTTFPRIGPRIIRRFHWIPIVTKNRTRFSFMSDNVATGSLSGDPLKTVADALETAVQAAKDGAADARATVDKVLPAASRFLSRFAYTTSYAISYGVVFPTVLVAKSIPTNNAVVHGIVDGARAAADMVDQMKNRQAPSSIIQLP